MKIVISGAGEDGVKGRAAVRWLLWLWVGVLLKFEGALNQCSAWEIKKFVTDITVHNDAHITVSERLRVDFGNELRHGIFRTIPYRYERHMKAPAVGMIPLPYNLHIKVHSVTDGLGAGLKYRVSRGNGYIEIRIGDPMAVVSGVRDYVITYDVWRAIIKQPKHVELYWNATGDEWPVPIGEAIARVKLPKGVNGLDERLVKVAFYTGPYGSTAQEGLVWRAKESISFMASKLQPGHGLTIVVGMPADAFLFPGSAQELLWALQDNWHIAIAFLAPLVALIWMLAIWYRSGRDPNHHLPIAVQYEPPKGLTPAEVGTLVDERADVADIIATVIDLAVRGYLKIREFETTKFLFLTNKDYEFVLLKPLESVSVRYMGAWKKRRSKGAKKTGGEVEAGSVMETKAAYGQIDEALERHEYLTLTGMFGNGERVLLSQLRNNFYRHLPDIRKELYRTLTKHKRLFYGDPDEVRNHYRYIGILVVAAIGGVILILSRLLGIDPRSMFVTIIGISLSGLIVWLLAPLMPRKSALGVEVVRHALGFREFILRAEKDRLERMASEEPTLFGRILPYAIVLGIVDEWAEKIKDIALQPPGWYEGSYHTVGFSTTRFVQDIGHAVHAMGNTFTSAPRRVGGEGFHFGSSGGGFGGGGGGAW
ncbi:MAG: DUF2207 domain-containing protein [Armatimonadota bacterium]|nr:DUF2207 domain-containing protein [Armatimonadota bacterium]MCX7777171.1 DUF2207 domain-containing protein [Armatimonadota bacterium]MDW8024998.1 DUF2207 domain-containing protein [Armatimonadota bacterium]